MLLEPPRRADYSVAVAVDANARI
jgi:hypothetical protein